MNIGVTDVFFSKLLMVTCCSSSPIANASFPVESCVFLQVPDDLIAIRTFVGCFWRQLKNCALVKIVLHTWNIRKSGSTLVPWNVKSYMIHVYIVKAYREPCLDLSNQTCCQIFLQQKFVVWSYKKASKKPTHIQARILQGEGMFTSSAFSVL